MAAAGDVVAGGESPARVGILVVQQRHICQRCGGVVGEGGLDHGIVVRLVPKHQAQEADPRLRATRDADSVLRTAAKILHRYGKGGTIAASGGVGVSLAIVADREGACEGTETEKL